MEKQDTVHLHFIVSTHISTNKLGVGFPVMSKEITAKTENEPVVL